MYQTWSEFNKTNPYRNYHAVRLHKPSFKGYRYKKDMLGKGVDGIIGIRQKAGKLGGASELQSIRFDREYFSIGDVRAWLKKHPKFKPILIEKADRAVPKMRKKPVRKNPSRIDKLIAEGPQKVQAMTGAQFASAVAMVSNVLGKRAKTLVRNTLKTVLGEDYNKVKGDLYFLGSDSAKVQHSAKSRKWFNVIQYLSPADRAALSFLKEFGRDHILKLVKTAQKTAKADNAWHKFASVNNSQMEEYFRQYEAIYNAEKLDPSMVVPYPAFSIGAVNACPFASPNCRAVCLNTSNRGGVRGDRKDARMKAYDSAKASGIIEGGKTYGDALNLFYIKGHKGMYAGQSNPVQAARIKRVHLLWLTWLKQGMIRNSYHDILFYSAMAFKEIADGIGVNTALRLNGTSDYPFHTARLQDVVYKGKSYAGENLVEVLGRFGVVCYDYTKDFERMNQWLSAQAWADPDVITTHGVKGMKNGFPKNYFLSFSWSEANGKKALQILRKGGNVVMVFRRSMEHKGDFSMPSVIPIAQLSNDPADRNWKASVINGDEHDLRFMDDSEQADKLGVSYAEYMTRKKTQGGDIVGLLPKGSATKPYTDAKQRKAWQHFANPVVLRKISAELEGEIKMNPAAMQEDVAVEGVDRDLYDQAIAEIGGYLITTTAMGT